MKDLRPIHLGDDLFACHPIAEAMVASGGDVLLTAKPAEASPTCFAGPRVPSLLRRRPRGPLRPHAGRRQRGEERTIKRTVAGKRLTGRYRWFKQVPLRDGQDAMLVDWIGVTITDAKGKVTYDNAFVTSLPVTRETAAEIVACARARWKIENESFNVLKSNGSHLEHNVGHGKQNLATIFASPHHHGLPRLPPLENPHGEATACVIIPMR